MKTNSFCVVSIGREGLRNDFSFYTDGSIQRNSSNEQGEFEQSLRADQLAQSTKQRIVTECHPDCKDKIIRVLYPQETITRQALLDNITIWLTAELSYDSPDHFRMFYSLATPSNVDLGEPMINDDGSVFLFSRTQLDTAFDIAVDAASLLLVNVK